MVKQLLKLHNEELLGDLNALIGLVSSAQFSKELSSYKNRILNYSKELLKTVNLNLALVEIGPAIIYKDILSRTQQAAQDIRLISSMWAIPILQSNDGDRLCLTTIAWLHQTQPETAGFPAAFLSGNCAIRPFQDIAPMYIFPALEQRSLLYQPLLFHEYGHFLYRVHKQEMDDLVRDLQAEIDELLIPVSQRNDRFSDAMAIKRQMIAYTWYAWAQELFCDAVGFTIGGPCFLQAFSRFLLMRDLGNFYREPQDLQYSSHPVTWLRIHHITSRAESVGFSSLAHDIETQWCLIAKMMNITEDYHGFYDNSLDEIVNKTIEDMLVEACPRQFTRVEASGREWNPNTDSPIRLFSWAWENYLNDSKNYKLWEEEQIKLLLPEI